VRDHLAVSQYPVGSPVQRKNFPLRNRTMALISDATLIIEAGETSGSLSQGWEALRLGRPLFVAESMTEDPSFKWPDEMLHYGPRSSRTTPSRSCLIGFLLGFTSQEGNQFLSEDTSCYSRTRGLAKAHDRPPPIQTGDCKEPFKRWRNVSLDRLRFRLFRRIKETNS
jgi:predicted Rossmann fold nucleotide-binding protein DprA/Smf involved in DNA uptake